MPYFSPQGLNRKDADKLEFRDDAIFINSSQDGRLDLNSDGTIQLNAPGVSIGTGAQEDISLVFDGNVGDIRLGIDDSADYFEIGAGHTFGTCTSIKINVLNGDVIGFGTATPDTEQILKWSGTSVTWADESGGGSGTITGVTGGDGLTGEGTIGSVTLDVGAGDGITVSANAIAVNGADGITLSANGVSVKGADGITVSANGVSVKGADGITVSANGVSVKGADGITVSANGVSVNAHTGITVDSNGVAVTAAQTGITSLLATNIKIGENDNTKIDFETSGQIHFYASGTNQVRVKDNVFGPVTDDDVDLGESGTSWKDAHIGNNFHLGGIMYNKIQTIGTTSNATQALPTLTSSTVLFTHTGSTDGTHTWTGLETGRTEGQILHAFFSSSSTARKVVLNFGSNGLYSGTSTGTSLTFQNNGESATMIYTAASGSFGAGWRIINTGATVS